MKPISRIAALLALLPLSGCETGTELPGARLDVSFSEVTVRGDYDATAVMTVSNTGDRTVLLDRCGDRIPLYRVDRKIGARWQRDRWQNDQGVGCLSIHTSAPYPLAPGESVAGTVWFKGPGRYRLVFDVYEAEPCDLESTNPCPGERDSKAAGVEVGG